MRTHNSPTVIYAGFVAVGLLFSSLVVIEYGLLRALPTVGVVILVLYLLAVFQNGLDARSHTDEEKGTPRRSKTRRRRPPRGRTW